MSMFSSDVCNRATLDTLSDDSKLHCDCRPQTNRVKWFVMYESYLFIKIKSVFCLLNLTPINKK